MLTLLPDPPARAPVGLAWLPPLLGLAGALQCGLPAAARGLLVLACALRLVQVWRSAWRGGGRGGGRGRTPAGSREGGAAPALLHATASGLVTWRGTGGAVLATSGSASRVDAAGVRLLIGGRTVAITPRCGGPRSARTLARLVLVRHDPRWQPRLPRCWSWRARRRAAARNGYNRALRVHRPPPCLPS